MTRSITAPAKTVIMEIRTLEEYPAEKLVRVTIGEVDAYGNFLVPQQFLSYSIKGEAYDELNSVEQLAWAPGKPSGTYRNEDLWHFVEMLKDDSTKQRDRPPPKSRGT